MALAPHYEEAATALKEKNIKIAKVDCVEEPDLCQSHEVQGYPTLKVFRNGSANDYTGPRKADGIISYMVKQSLPAVSDVTAANHEEFQKADKVVAIAYLASSTEAPAVEFSAAAEKHRDDYLFVSAVTTAELEEWIADLAVPVIDEVSGENYAVYANSPKPLAYLFLDPSDEKKQAHIEAIRPVAQKFKAKINFVWIDAIKFGDHAKALNVMDTKWPAFVVQDLKQQLKYPLDQSKDVTPEAAGEWVQQYLDGKLEPALKSAPIPETQDEPVFTLVGKQFDEIVFDDSKDVFLELYATCAKMEAQENDLPPSVPFRVAGFPTIKFKPAGTREFIDYDGDRTLESFVAFVEEHAKNSLELPKAEPVVPVEDAAQTTLAAETPAASATPDAHDEL
ncbi:Microtubule-nucleating Tub4p (gamma-tubulin) complex component [Salix suchowensis]|nr:Microtubule-nucleating Tub4p (gamma-tubulin) complex component [Salix suchowensis]